MSAASEYWSSLLRHAPLGILTDLDGTLLPFAATPEAARPTPGIAQLVRDLAQLPDTTLIIVSGRPRETLDDYFPRPRAALLVAEHGAWRGADEWESHVSVDAGAVDSLAIELRRVLARYPTAFLERKTWSLAFHFRSVPEHRKSGLLVQVASIVRPWLESHPDFERLAGAEVVEIRPRLARKGAAVAWARERLGPDARLILVGDDVTDEDMFAAASERDAPVVVTGESGRPSRARWALRSPADVLSFYRTILAVRSGGALPGDSVYPARLVSAHDSIVDNERRLLVLSNRLPELRSTDAANEGRKQSVGGLVSALRPVLERHRGIWLGWSGRTRSDAVPTDVGVDVVQGISFAWVDFPEEWQRGYYNGASNSALWPLFHSFPGRVRFSQRDWEAYRAANSAFAVVAQSLIGQETIRIDDYHLLLLGKYLRAQGFRGRIGFFQHIPFCGPDVFFLLPWAGEVLEAMLEFDLIGFHTAGYVENFLRCAAAVPGARVEGSRVGWKDRVCTVGAFPLGIIPADFQDPGDAAASEEIRRARARARGEPPGARRSTGSTTPRASRNGSTPSAGSSRCSPRGGRTCRSCRSRSLRARTFRSMRSSARWWRTPSVASTASSARPTGCPSGISIARTGARSSPSSIDLPTSGTSRRCGTG